MISNIKLSQLGVGFCVCAIVLVGLAADGALARFVYTGKWDGGDRFSQPAAIAADPTGKYVYFIDSGNNRIQKFGSDGNHLATWGGRGNDALSGSVGIALSDQYLYVVDSGKDRIQKFPLDDVKDPTVWKKSGHGDGELHGPVGAAIDRDGKYLYVADSGNNRIQKFDVSGSGIKYASQWGTEGIGQGQFTGPLGVAVGLDGSVYVSDFWNFRVEKFGADGRYISEWGEFGMLPGQFSAVGPLTVDSRGHLFTADSTLNRVQEFDPNGKYLTDWGRTGSDDGSFIDLAGIALDDHGNAYATDAINNRIEKFHYVNTAPLCMSGSVTVSAGSQVKFRLSCGDPDGDPVKLSVLDSPGSGQLSSLDSATGELTYVAPAKPASERLTFKASDGMAESSIASESITVTGVSQAAPDQSIAAVPRPRVTISSRRVRAANKGIITILLRCDGLVRCQGWLKLTKRSAYKKRAKPRLSVLESRRFDIAPGKTGHVKIRLKRATLRRLKKVGRSAITASAILDGDHAQSERRVLMIRF